MIELLREIRGEGVSEISIDDFDVGRSDDYF